MKPILDLTEKDIDDVKVETKYCVEKDIHELHIRKSTSMGYPPIPVADASYVQPTPIAIVCSGPSLKDTWHELKAPAGEGKAFPVILTCSGAHDYLIERGIIPTYHMETDPRQHKAVFTKNPRKETIYLIASSCHPDVFDNLIGHDVRLWHVVATNELHKMPRGHWMITGGCNVGLRALVMARLMGFRDVHVFGMDCSATVENTDETRIKTEESNSKIRENPCPSVAKSDRLFHVNYHPNEPKKKGHRIVKVGDREFFTSDVFLECARQFFKETMLLSDVRTTLHGDGLLQTLAAQKMSDPKEIEKRKAFIEKRGPTTIALSLPTTITQQYSALNRQLHEQNWDYGGHGDRYAKIVKKMSESNGIKSILDYGCGKGALANALDFPIWEYDPCIPGKEAAPRPADLVICTDVLEHIEPSQLTAVMEDLKRVVKVTAFFAIHTGPSGKTLADGRNTHLIQQGMTEWKAQLSKYFDIAYCSMVANTPMLYIVASARADSISKAA